MNPMFTAEAVLRHLLPNIHTNILTNPMFTAEAVLRHDCLQYRSRVLENPMFYCGSGIETILNRIFVISSGNPMFTAEAVLMSLVL